MASIGGDNYELTFQVGGHGEQPITVWADGDNYKSGTDGISVLMPSGYGLDLFQNPGFESSLNGSWNNKGISWLGRNTGYNAYRWTGFVNGYQLFSFNPYGGQYFGVLTVTVPPVDKLVLSQDSATVTGGERLTVKLRVRGYRPGTGGYGTNPSDLVIRSKLSWVDSSGTISSYSSYGYSGFTQTSWTELTCNLAPNYGAVGNFRIELETGLANSEYYIEIDGLEWSVI